MALTERQMQILDAVVCQYRATGRPVGSRTLTERAGIDSSPSTVRAELHRLEELGLLEHPHTSAGRVPTTRGYRDHVDRVLGEPGTAPAADLLEVGHLPAGSDLDAAITEVAGALAEATSMLAVASRPRARGSVVRHIEVVQPQPHLVVVVCITDAGDVSRHRVLFDEPPDPGLLDWAASYLNETITGVVLGRHLLGQRLSDPGLTPIEREILARLAPALEVLVGDSADVLVDGTAAIMPHLGRDLDSLADLVALLDERRRLLTALRRMLQPSRLGVRIGEENELPELRPLSVVATGYGHGGQPIGIVGVIGPRRMDYHHAVTAVREAARLLDGVLDGAPAVPDHDDTRT